MSRRNRIRPPRFHPGRTVIANQPQSLEIVGRNRLFEPAHVEFGKCVGKLERLFTRIGAVGIDEQLCFIANRFPSRGDPLDIAIRLATDLHLHARNPLLDPAAELLLECARRCTK